MTKKYTKAFDPSISSKDIPATQGMLHLVRSELKSEIKSTKSELKSEMESMRAEMRSGFHQMNAKFEQMDSKLEHVLSEVSRNSVLVEEQNSRNRVVLEGLSGLWHRQDRVETRMDELEKTVRTIARYKP